jgi:predicted Zn-dependent protease
MNWTSRRELLCQLGRLTLAGLGAPLLGAVLKGCKTLEAVSDVGAQIGEATGVLNEEQAQSVRKSGKAVARSFEDFTPEQEYYIGRTVGAIILEKYPPYNDRRANTYINTMGQTLALFSDMPETFGGYHFLIQDSDEINALSAPGGLVFITRGMLRCCPDETAVAAVLAHEIGHVTHKHGLQAIKKSRITSALTTLGVEGAKSFGGKELAQLTETFEASITDITHTLITSGYSRAFEGQADQAAVQILRRVGYDPNGLVEMLQQMKTRLKPGRNDFASTHPTPDSRIREIQPYIGTYAPVKTVKARQVRFNKALKKV